MDEELENILEGCKVEIQNVHTHDIQVTFSSNSKKKEVLSALRRYDLKVNKIEKNCYMLCQTDGPSRDILVRYINKYSKKN